MTFPCTGKPGCANCVSRFAPDGRLLFCTGKPGHTNCRRRVRPFRAGSFPLNLSRDSPSADGGNVAAPAAGAKRKDNLRFSFLFELLPFPCFLIWRRLPTCDRSETGVRQRIFSSVSFATCSQCQVPFCYTCGLLSAGATNRVAQFVCVLLRTAPANYN